MPPPEFPDPIIVYDDLRIIHWSPLLTFCPLPKLTVHSLLIPHSPASKSAFSNRRQGNLLRASCQTLSPLPDGFHVINKFTPSIISKNKAGHFPVMRIRATVPSRRPAHSCFRSVLNVQRNTGESKVPSTRVSLFSPTPFIFSNIFL